MKYRVYKDFEEAIAFGHSCALAQNMGCIIFNYDYNENVSFSLLDFLFPRRSLSGEEGEWITKEELRKLQAAPVIVEGTGLQSFHGSSLDLIVAAARYDSSPLLKKAIRTFKYARIPDLHEQLGNMIASAAPIVDSREPPVLCPVPLHWSRRFQRGFNQSELLAKVVAEKRGWILMSLLRRTRPTGHQAWRGREERRMAMKDAFSFRGSHIPAHVILIDDLCTSGSTLGECAKVLKQAGVQRVEGWVVALGS